MKKSIYKISLLGFLAIFLSCTAYSDNIRTIYNLSGNWKFKTGDNKEWAKKDFNDESWDRMIVPAKWEEEGYYGLDGYAWYRKTFIMPDYSDEDIFYLFIEKIDDSDEIYLNGKLIGRTGGMPPEYQSGYDFSRKYVIPNNMLNFSENNTIAIRVFDGGGEGGIIYGPVKIGIDENVDFLALNLAGNWKFHLHTNSEWKDKDYEDSHWDNIFVPSYWENQGYTDHDGYAWYRKTFQVKDDLLNEDLYIILGKIDDEDKVYLNGTLIGTVDDLKYNSIYNRTVGDWNIRRIYQIPRDLLQKGKNVIAVRVYDGQIAGGIYEGPIGIMTERNYYKFVEKYRYEKSFWDGLIELFWYGY